MLLFKFRATSSLLPHARLFLFIIQDIIASFQRASSTSSSITLHSVPSPDQLFSSKRNLHDMQQRQSFAPAGRVLTMEQAVALRIRLLTMAHAVDAGDVQFWAAMSPESYRNGSCIGSVSLITADFSSPFAAAYVRVEGMLLTQDRYIGGANRQLTVQQVFELKPLGADSLYLFTERSTVVESHLLHPQPVQGLSPYAATFFPKSASTTIPRPCSQAEVASDTVSLNSFSTYQTSSSASSADTPLPRVNFPRRGKKAAARAGGPAAAQQQPSRGQRCRR